MTSRDVPRHVDLDVAEDDGRVAIYELEGGVDTGVRLGEDDLGDVDS